MKLPFKVESLDDVPEDRRDLYEEVDGGYQLQVDGVPDGEEDVSGLKSALEKVKRERDRLRSRAGKVSDDDLEELERLREAEAQREEEAAKAAGKWDEIRAKLDDKHAKELDQVRAELTKRDKVIEQLTVTNELRSAIAKAGVKDEYRDAVEAMLLRQGPTVLWEDGKDPVGVFSDDVEGDRPIGVFVEQWAKSDAASPYMPPENGGGGGGGGQDTRRGSGKSWEGKKYAEMTADEKAAYTQEQYEAGAYSKGAAA